MLFKKIISIVFLIITIITETTLVKCDQSKDALSIEKMKRAVIESDKEEIIKLVKKNKRYINLFDKKGHSPLYWAIMIAAESSEASESEDIDMVRFLIEHGADINKRNKEGHSSLYWAVMIAPQSKNINIIRFLIEHGAHINKRDNQGNVVLFYAVAGKDEKTIKFLIENGAQIDIKNKHGNTPFSYALNLKNESIKKLLESYYNLAQLKQNELFNKCTLAIKQNKVDVLKNLLNQKISPPIISSSFVNNQEQKHGNTLLHLAVITNNKDLVESLLKEGADINIQNNEGETPLHYAVGIGNKDMIEFFLKKQARTDLRDKSGDTPLDLAIKRGNKPDIIELFHVFENKIIQQEIPLSVSRNKETDKNQDFKRFKSIPFKDLGIVIYNNDAYSKETYTNYKNIAFKGAPLNAPNKDQKDTDDPIGYFLYLPKDVEKTKAIIVITYGGLNKGDNSNKIFNFILPKSLSNYLLSQNIGIMDLNTLDLKENENFQANMSQELFERILAQIKTTYDVLSDKKNRQNLHDILKKLPAKILTYLYGASFGGNTIGRYAEKYPKTFNGYISHNGALADQTFSKYLRPDLYINELQDNLLILQNYTDNVVFTDRAVEFYKKLKAANKDHLALFHFFPVGNLTADESYYIGHYFSKENWYLQEYAKTILDFIEKTKNGTTQFSDPIRKMRTFFYKTSFQEHAKQRRNDKMVYTEVIEKFVSVGFKLYKNALIVRDERFIQEKFINKEGLTVITRNISLPTDEFMKNNFFDYKKRNKISTTLNNHEEKKIYENFLYSALNILSNDSKKADASWNTIYYPIVQKLVQSHFYKGGFWGSYFMPSFILQTMENHILKDFYKECREKLLEILKQSQRYSFDVIKSKIREHHRSHIKQK